MENAIVDYMLRSNDKQYVINDYIENDPLSEKNLDRTLELVNEFRLSLPQKSIWIYSGYTFEECQPFKTIEPLEPEKFMPNLQALLKKRYEIISQCDVLVDGRYIDSQRDISYPFAGSRNQRIISIQESIKKGEIVLWQI